MRRSSSDVISSWRPILFSISILYFRPASISIAILSMPNKNDKVTVVIFSVANRSMSVSTITLWLSPTKGPESHTWRLSIPFRDV
uniref:Uncharacterized protein n=1 Tax=Arundo donax TaxID=35708 RepID=A0A0A9EUI1_ARUDO